ncbi:Nucleotidylyl transferase [Dentipellis sp. KUC8613]|nr:Nucleotidylyl transferase [Dentipellis sp. KUC8613]
MHHADCEAAIRRIQLGTSSVELVHSTTPTWPLTSSPPSSSSSPLRISVLDSSFNPPTLAHLALALSPPPAADHTPYDARLLLLSVRNADKQLKPGDATHAQRMQMMGLLAQDMAPANVAVAIMDEPTFVGKSAVLLAFLRARFASAAGKDTYAPKVQLTFLQGTDTLERLLAPRYYGSMENMRAALSRFFAADGDDSRVVCARRVMATSSEAAEATEVERRASETIKEMGIVDKVSFINIGDDKKSFSSSEVRAKIAGGDESWKTMVTHGVSQYIEENNLYRPL